MQPQTYPFVQTQQPISQTYPFMQTQSNFSQSGTFQTVPASQPQTYPFVQTQNQSSSLPIKPVQISRPFEGRLNLPIEEMPASDFENIVLNDETFRVEYKNQLPDFSIFEKRPDGLRVDFMVARFLKTVIGMYNIPNRTYDCYIVFGVRKTANKYELCGIENMSYESADWSSCLNEYLNLYPLSENEICIKRICL